MSKFTSCLPFVAASVLAAVALALPAACAGASSLPDYPFVHVSGTTSRIELPDMATLDFEMVAADADPAAARAVLDTRAGEIRALMQQLGTALGLEREEFRMPRKAGNAGAGDMDREQLMMLQTLKLRQSVDVIFRLENAGPARARAQKRP